MTSMLNNNLLFLFLVIFVPTTNAQIYVSQHAISGSNDGSSWFHAYLELGEAIEKAREGDEIWVTLGEYYPPAVFIDDGNTIDTTFAFYLDKELKIYGGFVGTETSKSQRNPAFNPVILNGDVANNDLVGRFDTLREDNARHIFYITENITNATILDGLYLWRGHAESDAQDASRQGGGVYSKGTPTIDNCWVTECYAHTGGGIYVKGKAEGEMLAIRNCNIENNGAERNGAGAYIQNVSSINIIETKISRNNTSVRSALAIDNCSKVLIEKSEIKENVGSDYAAMYLTDCDSVVLQQCQINSNYSNVAFTVYIQNGTDALTTFDQCRIEGNTSTGIGVGLHLFSGLMELNNCLLANNVLETTTGISLGVYNQGRLNLNHCTLSGNGIHLISLDVYSSMTINNSIIDGTIVNFGGGPVNSLGGNICSTSSMEMYLIAAGDLNDEDPLFINEMTGNFTPELGSPCIGGAINSNVTVDLDGNARDMNPDIGALENTMTATTRQEIAQIDISLYPVVSQDEIKIKWESLSYDQFHYQIIDQRGAILTTGFIKANHQPINISNFAAGQYQIIFTTTNEHTVRSFIKI